MAEKPIAAGKSSFDLVDTKKVFAELDLDSGAVVLDAACGSGQYSLKAAEMLAGRGMVFAVDLWADGIVALQQASAAAGRDNIWGCVANISRRIPLPDGWVDCCLMATVLHDLIQAGEAQEAIAEIRRVLKPGALLAVIEFKKIEGPPGPPMKIRLTADRTEQIINPLGFNLARAVEVGPYNYLSRFYAR